MNDTTTLVSFVLMLILIVIFGPIILIWALNTLFPALAIPTTFWTWLATLCLCGTGVARNRN